MFKFDVPLDKKESAYIERRRRLEEERKARIFNSKYRTIGFNFCIVILVNDLLYNCKISQIYEQQESENQKAINKALNEFRSNNQKPETRREWDLNDPNYLKKSTPARISNDDIRCGPASIQKFEGEDLESNIRKLYQQEQNREWLNQQMNAIQEEKNRQEEADRIYNQRIKELDDRLCELTQAEEQCRRSVNEALTKYNQELSKQKNHENLRENEKLNNNRITHMLNVINSDMLTENPQVAQSAFGPNRVITDRWKGMSEKQIKDIEDIRKQQVENNNRLKKEEKLANEMWNEQLNARDRAALLIEREEQRKKIELNKKNCRENQQLALEQRGYRDYLDRRIYTNEPQFFSQFNTTSR
ncbi:RIB43A-like with coiled-coils protein 2 [Octopus sinensis]|uniref:RIB43A-like with coiled-coils protein 2 n=1 Tax=Octopus sinensis TaxID=2607531 RepID=A0A6P7TQJ7_9MOLL|nr:RIB43A-like with coiled-coils protein 2 [Octopus sinensis]